jgi:hypothetical protein
MNYIKGKISNEKKKIDQYVTFIVFQKVKQATAKA